jgi:uncharacterized membrane protein
MIYFMSLDFPLIFGCWFLMLLWQLVGFPLVQSLFKNQTVDRGWAFGRLATWLVIATSIWFGAHLGLPLNQRWVVLAIFFVLAVYAQGFYRSQWSTLKKWWQRRWPLLLTEELVFLIFFVFLSLVRGFNPDINGLEKFMDVGLMQSYLRSPTLPAGDMWLAGYDVNYYTFGHFLGSIVTQFWGVNLDYAYNLLLGLLMGLIGAEAFSLAINLSPLVLAVKSNSSKNKKIKNWLLIKVGLVATVLIVLAGNGHAAWYLIKNQGAAGYWYPDATRFIEQTIHEFPAYSFIVSDLHAHLWGLPLVFFLLLNIRSWVASLKPLKFKKKKWRSWWQLEFVQRAFLLGGLLGLMMSTSAWDVLIYGLFLGVMGLVLLSVKLELFLALVLSALVVGLGTVIGASPWLLNFESISEGWRLATEHSPPWQLLVLWGPHVVMSLLALWIAVRRFKFNRQLLDRDLLIVVALVLSSLVLLVLPELVFMKDIYPNHPRANTMFKLTYQAFSLMSLAIAWLVGWLQLKIQKRHEFKLTIKLLLTIFLMAVLVYPYFGYRDFYGRLKNYQGLDGLTWLKKQSPADYEAIMWLRQNIKERPVILEAVGESYTTFARVSTFTGLPTVLGWRVHEWLWRGGFDIPGQRTTEVTTIYSSPTGKQAQDLIKEYQVEYIFVGSKEREAYVNLDEIGLRQLGDLIYSRDGTYIIRVD